jgi:hypothetical protein
MKRTMPRKLTIARETLGRLEEGGLKDVAGADPADTKAASVCRCRTETCITLIYSNCNLATCNCA